LADGAPVLCLDNHYVTGGQGDAVRAALAAGGTRVFVHGVERVPHCGTNDEVLRAHRLDAGGVADRIRSIVRLAL
jgi:transketolase